MFSITDLLGNNVVSFGNKNMNATSAAILIESQETWVDERFPPTDGKWRSMIPPLGGFPMYTYYTEEAYKRLISLGWIEKKSNELSNKGSEELIRKNIALAIMEQFWGSLPPSCDWEEQANDLLVTVDDSGEGKESVMDLTNKIFKAISK